ncbi:MAG: hypothetical protein N3F67_06200 [Acidilobaceae archaeon]|nr:hypothetical protein [Acidilobaceae archaeon]
MEQLRLGTPRAVYVLMGTAGVVVLLIVGLLAVSYYVPSAEGLRELALPAAVGGGFAVFLMLVLAVAYLARRGEQEIRPLEG